jgi:alpha-beta hydrolase superfamily lysophospholipase
MTIAAMVALVEKEGTFVSYDEFMNDVENLVKQAESNFSGLPKIIYGHSMGGNVVANYAIKRNPKVAGIILVFTVSSIPGFAATGNQISSRQTDAKSDSKFFFAIRLRCKCYFQRQRSR